jgi:hypothetical protein
MSDFWSAIWQYAFVVVAITLALGAGGLVTIAGLIGVRSFVHAPGNNASAVNPARSRAPIPPKTVSQPRVAHKAVVEPAQATASVPAIESVELDSALETSNMKTPEQAGVASVATRRTSPPTVAIHAAKRSEAAARRSQSVPAA